MVPTLKLNSGNKMPAIGFGTWKILLNGKAKTAVLTALESGYRLIDTARIYGNEKGVGEAVRECGIKRQEIFVTTKLWNWDQGYEKSFQAFDASIGRLGLDYVDLYLIHWPATEKRGESWRALEEIQASGRAKSIGVSNYTVKHLQELMNSSKTVPAVNQVEFHPFIYKDQRELLAFCKSHNIIVEAYSPLAHGYRVDDPTISKLAGKYSKTNGQIMLRWAIQHGTVPLPKASSPEHIKENIDVFNFEISAGDMETLNNLSDGNRTAWNPTNTD